MACTVDDWTIYDCADSQTLGSPQYSSHDERRQSIHSTSQSSSVSCEGPTTPVGGAYGFRVPQAQCSTPYTTSLNSQCSTPSYTTPCRGGYALYPRKPLSASANMMNELTARAHRDSNTSSSCVPASTWGFQDPSFYPGLPLTHCLGTYTDLEDDKYWVHLPTQSSTASSCTNSFDSAIPYDFCEPQSGPSSTSEDDFNYSAYSVSVYSVASTPSTGVDPQNVLLRQTGSPMAGTSARQELPRTVVEEARTYSYATPSHQRRDSRTAPYPSLSGSTLRRSSGKARRSSTCRSKRHSKIKIEEKNGIEVRDERALDSSKSNRPTNCNYCGARFNRPEHRKRHVDNIHPNPEVPLEVRPFVCALGILGGKCCIVNSKSSSRKAQDPTEGGRIPGIGRSDNSYQHYQTHIAKKNGSTRNIIVSVEFLFYVIRKHCPDQYEAVHKSLSNVFKKPPVWHDDGKLKSGWCFGEPNVEYMQTHPDYDSEFFEWMDEGCPPPEGVVIKSEPILRGEITAGPDNVLTYDDMGELDGMEDLSGFDEVEDPLGLQR